MHSALTRLAHRAGTNRRSSRATAPKRSLTRSPTRSPTRSRPAAESLERRVLLATVSGIKFNDLDGDGVGEVGEPGLSGWTIFHDANSNGTLDPLEASDVTDAGGNYSITFLAGLLSPTPEVIREIPRAGWRATTPPGGATTFNMLNSQSRTLNFGNTQRGLLTGTKFNDLDADGVRDAGEAGLANFTIFADLNNNGVLNAGEPSDVTDAAGNYALNLPTSATAYAIREVDQALWRQTVPGPQHAPASHNPTLNQPGQVLSGRDFGNTQRVLLTGRKINDLDADGVPDAGEPGVSGFRIYIDSNNDGNFDAGEPSDVTDTDGRYSFSPAGGGPFVLRELAQAGYRQTAPQSAANGDAHRIIFVVPFEGTVAAGYNFLNTRRPHISGIKFNDENANGVRDAGEAGLEGFTVYHDANDNNQLDAGETSAVTAASGSYELELPAPPTGQAAGYTIREVDQAFWRQTAPTLAEGEYRLSLAPGQIAANSNFGNTRRALVSGVKYEDIDGEGTREAGEPGVPGVRIYADYNNNGTFDAGEDSVLTAADGSYALSFSTPLVIQPGGTGTHIREVLPAGWAPITPANGTHALNVTRGATVTGRDFGNARQVTIRGRKFHDLDADGVDDATEPGLGDWRIYVDSNNNGVYDTDTETVAATAGLPDTTAQGQTTYSRINVSGLPPVITDVNVRVDITHPNVTDLSVFLVGPRGMRVLLFSNVGGTSDNIDRVLLDDESANTFAATAPPYANETLRPEGVLAAFDGQDPNGQWTIEVVDAGGAGVGSLDAWELILSTAEPSALTAATGTVGNYVITGLPPGVHRVREVRQAGWFPTAPTTGLRTVTTRSGSSLVNVDFGNALPGSISGRKWEDLDADGVVDTGEVGLAGWVIYRDLDDDGVMDTGNRRFEQATAGTIRDAIDLPGPGSDAFPGITQFVMPVAAPDGLIIDLNVAVNITHPRIADLTLSLTSPSGKTVSLTGDITAAGANMNTTFDDSAPNPVGAGTPPYTGVFRPSQPLTTFESDDPDGVWRLTIVDSAVGPAGARTLNSWALDVTLGDPRRVTDVSGAYSFADLRPGVQHVIREVRQSGWQQTFPTGDGAHRLRLTSDQDVSNRNFGNRPGAAPSITDVYVRGSTWAAPDPAALTFMEYLQANSLGHESYGYRVFGPGRTPPASNPHDILPWINLDQIVLRYSDPPSGAAVPTVATVQVAGGLAGYTVVSVTPLAGHPNAYVAQLARPLGGGNPVTGAAPTAAENGDHITLTVAAGAATGGNLSLRMKVLQGDTDHLGETADTHAVLARDFAEVKKKFFKETTSPVTGTDTDYSPFHDVDGSGSILARDFAEVKKRFFQELPPPPAAAAATATGVSPLFGTRRVRPVARSFLGDPTA